MGEVPADVKISPIATSMNCKVHIDYTNHRGERNWRAVVPHHIWHGTTEYHMTPQWLMTAWDMDKRAIRVFAMKDIHEFRNDVHGVATLSINVKAAPADTTNKRSV
jgi:predicted DNA-binding transcriptional regulator YafY